MWGEDTMKKMILLVCSLLLSWNASALNLAGIYPPEMFSAEANNDVLLAIGVQMQQMEQIFEAVEVVKKGDIITLDFQPDSDTKIIVNGTGRGVIAGTGFNRALLKVWLGKQPVQDDLKKGMLCG